MCYYGCIQDTIEDKSLMIHIPGYLKFMILRTVSRLETCDLPFYAGSLKAPFEVDKHKGMTMTRRNI